MPIDPETKTNTGVGQLDREHTTGSTILIQGCDDLSTSNRIIRSKDVRAQAMFSCRDTHNVFEICVLEGQRGSGR